MRVAVVGATGLVGSIMLEVIEQRNFPISELIPIASEKSVGKQITFKGEKHKVFSLNEGLEKKPHIALFSAGASVSLEWALKFANAGTVVIDNSSAWRMDESKKLIIPEINAHTLCPNDKIIANPNCSTIQMLMALAPLDKAFKLKRIVVSTYQSITGTGMKALQQLENEYKGVKGVMAYPYPIHQNALPHCDVFEENGYTKEEMKLVRETHKILNNPNISVSATAVRVPVMGGHSESVNAEFYSDFQISQVKKLLSQTNGIIVQDNVDANIYPMPIYSQGKDEVFVGRIRKDIYQPNTLNMWIVADNLRKGAATNAVQIAEYLINKKWM